MATSLHLVPFSFIEVPRFAGYRRLARRGQSHCGGVMAQQRTAFQGASGNYAREMERLSAKESLLLAFRDSGGFESLASGKTTEMQRIDVNERIVGLERLNPTPRPTTSPFLEGRWNFEWFVADTPGFLASKLLFERAPTTLAKLKCLNMLIKDGYSKVSASMRFLNSVEASILLNSKLSMEGPIRLKEEYIEGVLETPLINDEAIPEQLKSILAQATGTMQQLPGPIKDTLANGLKIPLGGTFQRLFMISYLDEEILIARDASGAPDVFTRLETLPETSENELAPDYES